MAPAPLVPTQKPEVLPAPKPVAGTINSVDGPTRPRKNPANVDRPVKSGNLPPSKRRSFVGNVDRSGTLVSSVTIDLSVSRVAFKTDEGAPIRGDVSTDLEPGLYTMRADTVRQVWVFDRGQVKAGLRFNVGLVGVSDPFMLRYVPKIPLLVLPGLQRPGTDPVIAATRRIVRDVPLDGPPEDLLKPNIPLLQDAFQTLDDLTYVTLYDVLDDLMIDHPEVINALLINFHKIKALDLDIDMYRILRALESFAVRKEELYVDAFDACDIDPDYFKDDTARKLYNKRGPRVRFTYFREPARSIILYVDDIYDDPAKDDQPPTYGEEELLYPTYLTLGTTPRMYAEAQKKREEYEKVEKGNIEFIKLSAETMMKLIEMTMFVNSKMMETLPFPTAAMRSARPISEARPISNALKNEPGHWVKDPIPNNMLTKEGELSDAAHYEARQCQKDPGIGYRRNGVQFDGYRAADRTLLEAKYWTANGRQVKLIRDLWFTRKGAGAFEKLMDQAQRQIAAAGGMQVEWRVASEEAAELLRAIFKEWNIPIQVVHAP